MIEVFARSRQKMSDWELVILGKGEEEDRLIQIIKEIGVPNGLGGVGYASDDVPRLVEGTLPQHRVTKLAPRPTGADELTELFKDSMKLW